MGKSRGEVWGAHQFLEELGSETSIAADVMVRLETLVIINKEDATLEKKSTKSIS